jgi:hypothetical protein
MCRCHVQRFGRCALRRDGTLIENVPYNGDPRLVRPVPGAREALAAPLVAPDLPHAVDLLIMLGACQPVPEVS